MIPVSRPLVESEELTAVKEVFDSGWLGMGSKTEEFEKKIKSIIGCKYALAVNTGTSALHIALDSFGISSGDEVLVPSITYAASIQAIISTGAIPVFCESDESTLLIDCDDVRNKLTSKTKAIMPVHYCGQACDMDTLLQIAEENDLVIIEDAAHAFGSSYKGKKIGSFGHATCFSFDPIKVITSGEGGAVVVQDSKIAETIEHKRILGIDSETLHRYKNKRNWFYNVTTKGYRYHMPNFCAAIGLAQLNRSNEIFEKRRNICLAYDAAFHNLSSVSPLSVNYSETVPFMYVIKLKSGQRDIFMDFLKQKGVGTGVHYIPNHQHPYFQKYVKESLPLSDEIGEQIVTLPLFYGMTEDDVTQVINSVTDFELFEVNRQ